MYTALKLFWPFEGNLQAYMAPSENEFDTPALSRLIKKKRERTQINKIRNERGEITMNTTEIQRIVRNY